jgi:hypothetical protein
MEHCLAPDTHGAQGIGCDNMTMLIVAILNGKTEEEWYSMIKDRVEKKLGYEHSRCTATDIFGYSLDVVADTTGKCRSVGARKTRSRSCSRELVTHYAGSHNPPHSKQLTKGDHG